MSSDGISDHDGHLLPQLLDLRVQIGILQIATAKLCARRGHLPDQHANLLAGVAERSFAHARRHIPLLFPKFHGVNPQVRVPP